MPLVQILVVVANTQVRTLRAEVEKGFERTAFDLELVDPKAQINLLNWTIRPLSGVYFRLSYYVERESELIFLNLNLNKRRKSDHSHVVL